MTCSFIIPAVLRRYSDGLAELALEGATIGALLEELFARLPALRERIIDRHGLVFPYFVVFHNDQQLGREELLKTALADGDQVEIIGAVVGGSGRDERDVRMRGFRKRRPLSEALAVALEGREVLPGERLPLSELAGRVLAEPIDSEVDVPAFRRSAMDGYAIRAEDSHGASLYDPLPLTIIGESLPGSEPAFEVGAGEACRIMTGAALPEGADAVLKAEDADEAAGKVSAKAAITPGKNVGRVGEDIRRGQRLLEPGRRLRPQDVGLLASIGCASALVRRRPRVRLLITGSELLEPGEKPRGARIVDSNSPMLKALLERDGAVLAELLRLPDDPDQIRAALLAPGVDLIVATGGSSVGKEDFLPVLVRELGSLPVHGVALRPAAPTGIGLVAGRPVFLLPGNPVSCLCGYDLLASPALRVFGGRSTALPYRRRRLPLSKRMVSAIGRVDYVRVRISDGAVEPLVAAGASVLSSTTRADGFVLTEEGSEGAPEGTMVLVHLYDDDNEFEGPEGAQ